VLLEQLAANMPASSRGMCAQGMSADWDAQCFLGQHAETTGSLMHRQHSGNMPCACAMVAANSTEHVSIDQFTSVCQENSC
jgi:hypothetical protein